MTNTAGDERGLDSAANQVTVEGGGEGFAQSITIAQHRLLADEPASAGGTDTGPNPYDYLLVALGSCTSMTVSGYARRKGWSLTAVSVRLRHQKIHAIDCAECETKDGMLDRIESEIHVTGSLTIEQKSKLLEIALKCPVHRTLKSEIDIQSRLIG